TLLTYVRATPQSEAEPTPISDWRELLERPAGFRGRLLQVEGTLGRNSSWTWHSPSGEVLLSQFELSRPHPPIACTLVFAAPADDLPIGAQVTVSGYFLMIRNYYDSAHRLRQAALLVGRGPTRVAVGGPARSISNPLAWRWIIAALGGGLLVAWLILRRTTS